MLMLSLVVVPVVLLATEYARDARYGSLLPDAGVAVSEAASLRGSLDRYYRGDEMLNGREIAISVTVSGYTSRARPPTSYTNPIKRRQWKRCCVRRASRMWRIRIAAMWWNWNNPPR